eukprot:CAMPEP_0182497202 /NCGR_PEP_ID=MMETSP1321-20130603/5735_1 /TAXON_ID=91990 /ORGANISM="Bolidomonas sp., Strain RCC1657" /LENGTH=487 /DNA_ID=CAMNT_0024701021 /DNA_START=28 /DNA_END=1488 /DNA_ORIENTATION=+
MPKRRERTSAKKKKKKARKDVLPEEPLAAFALTLSRISEEWPRDFLLSGNSSGQSFTKAIATSTATKLFSSWFGPLIDLTDLQQERLWELLPGMFVDSNGEVDISFDSDFEGSGLDIQNNKLSALNSLKLLAYLAYIAHACPPLVTVRLSDPCDTELRLGDRGRDLDGNDLTADETATAKASLLLQDRRNALFIICSLLLDPLLKEQLTEAGKESAAAAIELVPLLHNNSNDTSAGVYERIRGIISEHPSWSKAKKARLLADWAPVELGSNERVDDKFLKILPNPCFCGEVFKCSDFMCPPLTLTDDSIGDLAEALACVPGRGDWYELDELEWQGSKPGITHDNKNDVRINFLRLYRGHLEKQVDGSKKVVGGNCGIDLMFLNGFLDAFDRAKEEEKGLQFLYEDAFKILVEGFHPCSFTVHTAEEGVLRLHAEEICGEWPFDSNEPASFKGFEKVRQEFCQQAHIEYWDGRPKKKGGWGKWHVKVR